MSVKKNLPTLIIDWANKRIRKVDPLPIITEVVPLRHKESMQWINRFIELLTEEVPIQCWQDVINCLKHYVECESRHGYPSGKVKELFR